VPREFGDRTVSAAGRRTLNVLAANVHRGRADPAGIVNLVDGLHPKVLTIEEYTAAVRR
jgi:hypothetical protein